MGLLLQRECTVLKPLITPVPPSGSALLCSVQPILLLSLPPLQLVTRGPFCEWPLPTAPAFCPRLPPPHTTWPLPSPTCPHCLTLFLYFLIEFLVPQDRGAEWC